MNILFYIFISLFEAFVNNQIMLECSLLDMSPDLFANMFEGV